MSLFFVSWRIQDEFSFKNSEKSSNKFLQTLWCLMTLFVMSGFVFVHLKYGIAMGNTHSGNLQAHE